MKHSKLTRFCSILLILVMLFGLVACGKKEKKAEESKEVADMSDDELKELLPEMTEDEKDQAISLYHEHQEEILAFLETLEGKPEDEQVEQIQAKLDELYEGGYLMEPATYNEDAKTFTVVYKDGSPNGRMLVIPMEIPGDDGDDPETATNAVSGATNAGRVTKQTNSVRVSDLSVLVLEGFEDDPWRTDYYEDLEDEWSDYGMDITVDYDITVADMANLSSYDAVVFSMHGWTAGDNVPLLAIGEMCTAQTDAAYYDYITQGLLYVAYYIDGSAEYLIPPDFFSIYGMDGLSDTFFFSETCLFYGGPNYCTASSPDRAMADALLNAGASTVIGYYDSVLALYSRDVMKATLDGMFDGQTANAALNDAKDLYGEDDGYSEDDGVPAVPILSGDKSFTFPMEEDAQPEPDTPTEPTSDPEEPTPTEQTGDDIYLQDITQEIILSLAQLFGVNPTRNADGLYCIPYTNTTPYTFTIEVTVRYFDGSECISTETQQLTFEPGQTVNVPFAFPERCSTGRLSYQFLDIYYGDRQVQ